MSLGATEATMSIAAVQNIQVYLMHLLQYCSCCGVFDTGKLMLIAICVKQGFKVRFEFTAIVIMIC